MTILWNDFETYCDLDITEVGTSRYSRHPSAETLMLAYAFDDGPVQQWVPVEGDRMPAELREAMEDPAVLKSAWNKPFEWSWWANVEGIRTPHNAWRDTMVLALACSLPGKLEKAGEVIGLPSDLKKMASGKRLIRRFCTPQKPTRKNPQTRVHWWQDLEKWNEFLQYNRNDVEAERAIYRRLRKYDLPPHEWALWHMDQEINEAGIPINMVVVRNAIKVAKEVTDRRLNQMREITGLDNPNSNTQLLPWLQDHGYRFEDLKKGHVDRALKLAEEELDMCGGNYRYIQKKRYIRVLELRQEVSKASVKKYNALEQATDEDGYLRYTLQFAGAGRTWRWAGRKYQAQNLARPAQYLEKFQEECVQNLERLDTEEIEWLYDKPMDLLSTCVRPVVQTLNDDEVFIDADLNAIENRVLGWMSGDRKILAVFEKDRDPYVDFATYMFREPYEKLYAEYKAGDKTKRTTSKPAVLGCGYCLGPGAEYENATTGEIEANGLLGYAWNMGVPLTREQAETSVSVWRATFTDAVEYWNTIEQAAKRCVKTGARTEAGPVSFNREGPFLRMRLPSGRHLYYIRPRLDMKPTPWGAERLTLTYEQQNEKNQWVRVPTHRGKLTENADQAISRDILAHGMVLARRQGLDIRLHVHDQIVSKVLKIRASDDLAVLRQCMAERPKWAPDLPLASAGFISKYFTKD